MVILVGAADKSRQISGALVNNDAQWQTYRPQRAEAGTELRPDFIPIGQR